MKNFWELQCFLRAVGLHQTHQQNDGSCFSRQGQHWCSMWLQALCPIRRIFLQIIIERIMAKHYWGWNSCLHYGLTFLSSNPLLQHHFWNLGIAICLDCIMGFEVFNTYNKGDLGLFLVFLLCTFPTNVKKELSDIWVLKPAVCSRAHYTWVKECMFHHTDLRCESLESKQCSLILFVSKLFQFCTGCEICELKESNEGVNWNPSLRTTGFVPRNAGWGQLCKAQQTDTCKAAKLNWQSLFGVIFMWGWVLE